MTRTADWHAAYRRLEIAESAALAALRVARARTERKRVPAGAMEAYSAATETARVAGQARWEFEMADVVIVDIATLPAREWLGALCAK